MTRDNALLTTSAKRALAVLAVSGMVFSIFDRSGFAFASDYVEDGVTCSGDGCYFDDAGVPATSGAVGTPVTSAFKTYTDKGAVPFSISVDGEALIGSSPPPVNDPDEFFEPGIEGVDIQVKFDGLQVQPALNVSTKPIRRSYEPGEVITFYTSSNYPDWITNSEVRIFRRGASSDDVETKVLPVDATTGEVEWTMPEDGAQSLRGRRLMDENGNLLPEPDVGKGAIADLASGGGAKGDYFEPVPGESIAEPGNTVEDVDLNPDTGAGEYYYVYRVYDAFGNYDETAPLSVTRASYRGTTEARIKEYSEAPGYGEDRTGVRNITVNGGAVTIYGRNIPRGYKVRAFRENIPVGRDGGFVVQRILPPGEHDIDVAVRGDTNESLSFTRNVNIPDSDWFYVALADLTVGRRFQSSSIVRSREDEFKKVYHKGRLAFYLKGKVRGQYLLTAAADTGEQDLENIFKGLDEKDPRQFLRRLDPDDFYPVYGDDSTLVEDAPTQGKFFVRIARGPSHAMWGNFKTKITGTTFLRNERSLYGAQGVYRSQDSTYFGEARTELRAYAAQPRTLAQRDVLQGTGGSAYFLKRQDITTGSETITVEVRNTITGQVINRKTLLFAQDYEIDYVQGIVILKAPLSSHTGGTDIVQDGTLSGERINLVVQYEYTPGLTDVRGYSYGGRAQHWFWDRVRVGATALREKSGITDLETAGADVQIRYSERTYIEGEIASSKGIGLRRSLSTDGGLIIVDEAAAGTANNRAVAMRLRGQIALEELLWDEMRGTIGGHYEELDAGFSSLDRSTTTDERTWGVHLKTDEQRKVSVAAKYDDFRNGAGTVKSEGNVNVNVRLFDDVLLGVGAKHTRVESTVAPSTGTGSRTDVGLRLTKKIDEDTSIYGFGQGTVSRTGTLRNNNRGGVGGETKFTDKIGLRGQISGGSTGLGALAAVTYDPTADDHYYFGYRLDPDRTDRTTGSTPLVGYGRDMGGIVLGARRRFDRYFSAFAENNYDIFGQRLSLTQTYGVTYTPSEAWTHTAGLEVGYIQDDISGDFERQAVSMSIGYDDQEDVKAQLRLESRFEDSDDNLRDRVTYLLSAGLTWSRDEDWRVLTKIDAVLSDSDQTNVLNGDYIEGSIGYAYRPIDNDIVNALFKYTFLYDLPGPSQVNSDGLIAGPMQRSHVLSADITYDLNEYLSVGGKYGFRIGEVSTTRSEADFIRSSAHLAILRADFHVVKNWDVLLEGRVLHTPEVKATDFGALFAIYRHVGENLKVGVGYNFGRFSDDVTDLTHDDDGVFVNAIGKF